MTRSMRTGVQVLLLAGSMVGRAGADAPRRFDLGRNFFSSDGVEERDRDKVRDAFARLSRLAPGATKSAAALAQALTLWSDTERQFRLHDLFFFARSAVNTDEHHDPEMESVRAARKAATRAVRDAICAAAGERLQRYVHDQRVRGFRHFIGSVRDECRHRPDARVQSAIDGYEFASDPSFYFEAIEGTDFGSVETADGKLDVLRNQGKLLADPAQRVRDETSRKLWDGYAKHKDLFAYGLAQIVHACETKARLGKYSGCVEKELAAEELTVPQVRRWYDQIAQSWPWARTVAADAAVDPTGLRFTFDQASAIIERAVARLGPDYQRETKALLEPANGRIDVEGGPHRVPIQGTASVDPVGTSIFYAFHFEGNYLDLMLLAHESGHAVQAMMMSRAGVPALNGRGAAWMTESFGRFNEFLVADSLYTAEQDPRRKALFRSELVKRAHVLYGAASEGAVELALHERIARGHASADALSDVTRKEGSRFSDRFAQPFDPLLWTRVETYYADPLHATSSMVSSILGLVLYHRFREAPDRFVEGYARLLSNGYDDTSQELLERFVGIDVNSETLVEEAIGVLRELSR